MRAEVVVGSPVVARSEVRERASSWSSRPVHVVVVDAAGIRGSRDLFRALADALDFPDYFGFNWDALVDCLGDYLSLRDGGLGATFGVGPGVDARGLLLVLIDADRMMCREPDLVGRLVAALSLAATGPTDGHSADLWVVLHTPDEAQGVALSELLGADS